MTLRLGIILSVLCSSPSIAHYDVNAAVEKLTVQIKTAPTAELYYQRAIEFRALREKIHAEEDLRASLALKPYAPSLKALAKRLSQKGEHEEALLRAQEAILVSPIPHHQLLLADIAFAAGKHDLALEALVQGPPEEDHTHLLHAHLLFLKDQHEGAAAILKNSYERTKSIVLRNAWLDAAILSGDATTVLPILNKEIESSRFTASHRIRRAQISPSTRDEDLQFALTEINSRLNPKRPDLTLIGDRRKVYLLLGEKEKAAAELALMKKRGLVPLGPWMLKSM